VDSFEKNYPETKTGQGDKETGREGDEETLRTAKDKGERIKEPCSWLVLLGNFHVLIILKTSK
jgi:hypothetical protein